MFMVANPVRRRQITDAAIACLGEGGGRSLTHRAVDARAGLPSGTTSNYFGSRSALVLGMAERIFELLAPDQDRVHEIATSASGADGVVAYIQYVVERLLGAPQLALALIELRLEAARNPGVAEVLEPFLRHGLHEDRRFHASTHLPGGPEEIELLHYAIDGLVLDQLTVQINPESNPAAIAEQLTRRLLISVAS